MPVRRRRLAPFAVLVLLVGLSITAVVTWGFQRSALDRDAARFNTHVEAASEQIRGRLAAYMAVLFAARGLMAVDANITAEEFARFVDHLELPENYPGSPSPRAALPWRGPGTRGSPRPRVG